MKEINCEVIQDLLPSYSDKISSKSTNELVEGHLQKCENCREVLSKMNKDIDINVLNSNDTKIDYLKGYKKRKKKIVIISIVLTIIILLGIFLMNVYNKNIVLNKYEYVDVDRFNVEYLYEDYNDITGEKIISIYLYSEEYKYMALTGSATYYRGNTILNYEIAARNLPKDTEFEADGIVSDLYINDDIEKIYIVDMKGKKKEIWNKNMKVQTKEEWEKWYIDSYLPKEIKDLYNMSYDNIPFDAATLKHIYNRKYNK